MLYFLFNIYAVNLPMKLALCILLLLIVFIPNAIEAQTAGPNSAGTGTNLDLGPGNPSWSNPGNIIGSDDSDATVTLTGFLPSSDALIASNFGFTIDPTATIDGISVNIEKARSAGFLYVADLTVQLTKDGTTPIGTNQPNFANWATSDTNYGYGGATDLWGATWTPAEINNSTFGLYFRAISIFGTVTGYIDHITITIYYSVPTPVELISFEGDVVQKVIELKWRTSWEENNDFFTIEKSVNGLSYIELGTVSGKGTVDFFSDYSYIDPLPFSGYNYYRLSQTDFNGTTESFKPIMVQYYGESQMMKVFPNPSHNESVYITIHPDLFFEENSNVHVNLRNISGGLVLQQAIPSNHLGDKIMLNGRFERGVYVLELHSPYGLSSEKLIIE